MRLAHASMTFGGGESAAGDAQIFNVGGSVAAPGSGGLAALEHARQECQAAVLLHAHRQAQCGRIGLSGPGIPRCFVGSGRGRGQLAHQRRRSQCDRHDHRAERPGIRPNPGICSSIVCSSMWRRTRRRMLRDQVRTRRRPRRSGFADPRGIPAINFHATELIWGERQFGDVTATLAKLDDGIALKQLERDRLPLSMSARTASGAARTQGSSRIKGALTSTDVQGTLKDLGYADVIQAKSGKVEFRPNWVGAPDRRVARPSGRPRAVVAGQGSSHSGSSPAPAGYWAWPASPRCRAGWRWISAI